MNTITASSPAKINLFLAVTGRRPDGFHDLVSVVAPVSFGDELKIEAGGEGRDDFSLECSQSAVPRDASNLILRAAEAFRAAAPAASGWTRGARFSLDKKIPMGAGLGGGSSNAVAALRGLNEMAGHPLDEARLAEIAAELGSDCALFLRRAPVVMRGRGERVATLPAAAARRLSGRRVLIFKPDVSINTAWAYGQMVGRALRARREFTGTETAVSEKPPYLPAEQAEARLAAWIENEAPAENLLFNNMEPPAFEKFIALPVLLAQLRERFGVAAGMSGSGSACFALLREGQAADEMVAFVREAWGREAFAEEARIL